HFIMVYAKSNFSPKKHVPFFAWYSNSCLMDWHTFSKNESSPNSSHHDSGRIRLGVYRWKKSIRSIQDRKTVLKSKPHTSRISPLRREASGEDGSAGALPASVFCRSERYC